MAIILGQIRPITKYLVRQALKPASSFKKQVQGSQRRRNRRFRPQDIAP
jgi:hypothetical protein